MAGSVIAVTGFEPFGDHAVGPSEGPAKAVDGRQLGKTVVRGLVLPVGLIHVPLLPAMVAASGADAPSKDFSVILRSVEAAFGVIATHAARAASTPA